jgi:hypothetical protein
MKKLLAISLFLFCALATKASHITHGNMYYQYVGTESNGNYRYKITLLVVRDCAASQVQFDDPIVLGVYAKGQTNYNLEQAVTVAKKLEVSTDPIGVYEKMGSPFCLRRATYETEIVLKSTVASYYVTLTRCCHPTMNNIVNADENGNLFHLQIPVGTAPYNSSPMVYNETSIVLAVGIVTTITLAEDDYDSDSLTYNLTDVIVDGGINNPVPSPTPTLALPFKPATYRNYYNSTDVLGSSPSYLKLNEFTGVASAFPNISGRYLLAYNISEWQNGKVINTYYREKEIVAIPMPPDYHNRIILSVNAAPVAQKKINLHWVQNIQRSDSGIFVLQRRLANTNNWSTIATLDSTTLQYADTTISYDSFYVYRLTSNYYNNNYIQKSVSNLDSAIVRRNTVGLTKIDAITAVELYPNPAQNILHINASNNVITAITITNTLGEIIKTINIADYTGTIDIKSLPTGIYFIEITAENNSRAIKKFIKN